MHPRPTRGAFYADVLLGLPEAVLVTNEAGVIRYANRAAESFYGGSQPGLTGLSVSKLFPNWFGLPASCRNFPTQSVLWDGTERLVTLSLAPIQTQKFVAAVAVFQDASQSEENTERMFLQETSLRAQVMERDDSLASMRTQLGEAAQILEHHLPARSVEGVEVSWIFEPCQTLGGDMLLIHRHQDKVILGVLDVSGHGVAASLLAIGMSRSLSPERGRGGVSWAGTGFFESPWRS